MRRMKHEPGAAEGGALPEFDDWWDFGDPAASEARFAELLPRARREAPLPYTAELLTQLARAQGLQRRFDDARRTLDEAERALSGAGGAEPAERAPRERARMRLLLERGRLANSSGDTGAARPLFEEAWAAGSRLAGGKEAGLTVDAAHMIAIVAPPEEALEWNRRALAMADASPHPQARRWRGSLLNNIGWTLHGRGDFAGALDSFERALAAWREAGGRERERVARWCIARTLRSLGRHEEALSKQRELLAEHEGAGSEDGFVFEELGECLLALERAGEARPWFRRAFGLLSRDAWLAAGEPDRLARLERLGREGPLA